MSKRFTVTLIYHIGVICYDDGCHLKRFARKRAGITTISTLINEYEIVVDKMHFAGHTDSWCQENCNPYNLEKLNAV